LILQISHDENVGYDGIIAIPQIPGVDVEAVLAIQTNP